MVHRGRGLNARHVRWLVPAIVPAFSPVRDHRGEEAVRGKGGESWPGPDVKGADALASHREEASLQQLLKGQPRSDISIEEMKPGIGRFGVWQAVRFRVVARANHSGDRSPGLESVFAGSDVVVEQSSQGGGQGNEAGSKPPSVLPDPPKKVGAIAAL